MFRFLELGSKVMSPVGSDAYETKSIVYVAVVAQEAGLKV